MRGLSDTHILAQVPTIAADRADNPMPAARSADQPAVG